MKASTSFTKQQVMLQCPRRFFYRYLDGSAHAQALKNLISVRELGGHCIHSTLAQMVRRIANGERISDQTRGVEDGLRIFDEVVQQSRLLRPGVLSGGMQLAEAYNGVEYAGQVRDWRELIAIAMTNGFRFMSYFDLHSNKSGYQLEAEQKVVYSHRGRTRHLVIDVLIRDATGTSVIDWKTHSITETDLHQISLYQNYLLDAGLAHPTRIFGFAVDLLNERVVEHHYRKIEHTLASARRVTLANLSGPARVPGEGASASYAPKPSAAACSICSFATLCPSSALLPVGVDREF